MIGTRYCKSAWSEPRVVQGGKEYAVSSPMSAEVNQIVTNAVSSRYRGCAYLCTLSESI